MRRIPALLFLLMLFPLFLQSGIRTRQKTVCLLCTTSFKACKVQFNRKLAFGGVDWDFCPHSFRSLPFEDLVWTCPNCGYSAPSWKYSEAEQIEEETGKKLRKALAPAVPLKKRMKQEAIPGWAKWDLSAQRRAFEGAGSFELGKLHLQASWAARQRGAVRLPEFAEWTSTRAAYNLHKNPLELGLKKNRGKYELDRAEKIEKDLAKGGWKSGCRAVLVRYLCAWLYRRHGENTDALRIIGNMNVYHGQYSFVDDALEEMKVSIGIERRYQRKAAGYFSTALASAGKNAVRQKRRLTYMLGELHRRLEDWNPARKNYKACIALGKSSFADMAAIQLKKLPLPEVKTGSSGSKRKK